MSLLAWQLLLADRNMFRSMGSGIRDRREHFEATDLIPWLLVIGGVLTVLVLIARYVSKRDTKKLYNSPRALFRALCDAHELERPSRKLLKQLARSQSVSQPARLFLEPERFESASLSPIMQVHKAAIAALKTRLFAHGDEVLALVAERGSQGASAATSPELAAQLATIFKRSSAEHARETSSAGQSSLGLPIEPINSPSDAVPHSFER